MYYHLSRPERPQPQRSELVSERVLLLLLSLVLLLLLLLLLLLSLVLLLLLLLPIMVQRELVKPELPENGWEMIFILVLTTINFGKALGIRDIRQRFNRFNLQRIGSLATCFCFSK